MKWWQQLHISAIIRATWNAVNMQQAVSCSLFSVKRCPPPTTNQGSSAPDNVGPGNPILPNGWPMNYGLCGSVPQACKIIDDHSQDKLIPFHQWVMLDSPDLLNSFSLCRSSVAQLWPYPFQIVFPLSPDYESTNSPPVNACAISVCCGWCDIV